MSLERHPDQPIDYQELDLQPWSRLLGFGGPASLVMVPLDLQRREAAGLVEEVAAAQYLGASEQQHLQGFSFPRRRLQWLGGRLSAKVAAGKLLGNNVHPSFSWHHLQVAAEPSGRPYLQWSNEAPVTSTGLPDISISHSGPVACALAAGQPARCGVDIQMVTEAAVRVKERFAASSELAILEGLAGAGSLADRLTLLWSAKEAIRKTASATPLPGFLEMSLASVTPNSSGGGREGFLFTFRWPPWPRASTSYHDSGRDNLEVAAMFWTDAALAFTILDF